MQIIKGYGKVTFSTDREKKYVVSVDVAGLGPLLWNILNDGVLRLNYFNRGFRNLKVFCQACSENQFL